MRIIRKTTEVVIVLLFVVLVVVVFYQVVARYIFNDPPSWTEELARYCQVWIILLTSSICIRKGTHLAVDYFDHKINRKAKGIINIIMSALITLYILVILIFGWKLMIAGQYQLSPALQIKMSFVYMVFPISGVLMLLEALIKTSSLIKERIHNLSEN